MRMLITPAPTSFPDVPTDDLIPYFLALSDVLGTGCFGAVAAKARPDEPPLAAATARPRVRRHPGLSLANGVDLDLVGLTGLEPVTSSLSGI